MKIHIGIVTWNRLELTRLCLESLFTRTHGDFSCTVVDNGSRDGTVEYLSACAQRMPNLTLRLLSRNMGVSVASNLAWDDARQADFFIKLDNDVEICDPDWLLRLVRVSQANPTLGPLGYRLCSWHTGTARTLSDGTCVTMVSCCNGACACIPRILHEKLGFWNEGYGRYGYEDLEYSWRALKAGFFPAYIERDQALVHHGTDPKQINLEQEEMKKVSRTSALHGTKAYLLYLFLFEQGLLPLKMGRKYLIQEVNGKYIFALNGEYKHVQKLMNMLVKTVQITQDGEISCLDLHAWQSAFKTNTN